MPVVLLDGCTVRDFVADSAAFHAAMDQQFHRFDADADGRLSPSELRSALERTHLALQGAAAAASNIIIPNDPIQLDTEDNTVAFSDDCLYASIFDLFDADRSGFVEFSEFLSQMRSILLAIADGLGSSPMHVALDNGLSDGLLHYAALHDPSSSSSPSSFAAFYIQPAAAACKPRSYSKM